MDEYAWRAMPYEMDQAVFNSNIRQENYTQETLVDNSFFMQWIALKKKHWKEISHWLQPL